jgi:hypothetical protein
MADDAEASHGVRLDTESSPTHERVVVRKLPQGGPRFPV